MKENTKIKFMIYMIIVFCVGVLGITFAWISIEVIGTPKDIINRTTSLKIVFTDSPAITTSDFEPNETLTKTFTIQNTGKEVVIYNLFWQNVTNTYVDQTDLNYVLQASTNGGNAPGNISATPLPLLTGTTIKKNITIAPEETHTYTLTITFIETGSEQNDNQEKIFSGKIYVEESISVDRYVQDGLILHYDGLQNIVASHSNNTTVWKDLSGHNNDGTLSNFSFNSTSGWLTNGLKFDGTNDVVVSNSSGTDFSQYKSGEAFSYCSTFTTGANQDDWHGIITNMEVFSTGGFNIQYGLSQGIALGYGQYLNANINHLLNTTYDVCGVYDGSVMKIYVNGTEKNSSTYAVRSGKSTLKVGAFYTIPSLFTNGIVHNVMFYEKALSSTEIIQNYNLNKDRFNF